ncbi:MAG: bifunctional DNA-formamidopyrimidine glycosylase/DNA-(apurinic or apyrimidinic site) lyase [Pseudomonadota bacterium]
MPELPEVETTKRGIAPFLEGATVTRVTVRQPQLRWPIPSGIQQLKGARVDAIERRGKYLLLRSEPGTAILHLGMSGSLRVASSSDPLRKHDHVDIGYSSTGVVRFHDPRRFGALLWTTQDPYQHKLLVSLGPEPLSDGFDGDYLFAMTRKRKLAIKNLIMNSAVVVGVGNIYACEALFLSGVRPSTPSHRVSRAQSHLLVEHIRSVLSQAIEVGGTTLRDFVNAQGDPGYFRQSLFVYGRAGEPCRLCGSAIKNRVIGQRSSFFCPSCQGSR